MASGTETTTLEPLDGLQEQLDQINGLDHLELCRIWRQALPGHPWFDVRLPYFEAFRDRLFGHFGGFTPAISKRLEEPLPKLAHDRAQDGWEIIRTENQRLDDGLEVITVRWGTWERRYPWPHEGATEAVHLLAASQSLQWWCKGLLRSSLKVLEPDGPLEGDVDPEVQALARVVEGTPPGFRLLIVRGEPEKAS
jgi:hypothetical protein